MLGLRDSFAVMASDGLWDVMSDTDAVATAAAALQVGAVSAGGEWNAIIIMAPDLSSLVGPVHF